MLPSPPPFTYAGPVSVTRSLFSSRIPQKQGWMTVPPSSKVQILLLRYFLTPKRPLFRSQRLRNELSESVTSSLDIMHVSEGLSLSSFIAHLLLVPMRVRVRTEEQN